MIWSDGMSTNEKWNVICNGFVSGGAHCQCHGDRKHCIAMRRTVARSVKKAKNDRF